MIVKDIPLVEVDVSEFNTRKDLTDGQDDSTINDLATSIEKQGLLNPITVFQKPDGKYALIAGQRRMLACQKLKWTTIPAIVRDTMSEADATAVSLVENVHRADMNPIDKARAFKTLADKLSSLQQVSSETGVSITTIRKYINLLALAPELQKRLAAGEVKNTEALARLAQRIADPESRLEVWHTIESFSQDVQQNIIKRVEPNLDNLNDLYDQALEGKFNVATVVNCPFDCPTIPDPLKEQVAKMILDFNLKTHHKKLDRTIDS